MDIEFSIGIFLSFLLSLFLLDKKPQTPEEQKKLRYSFQFHTKRMKNSYMLVY